MKRTFVVAAVAALFTVFASDAALACGDKFLVVGRGNRYQRGSLRPTTASILIYAGATSSLLRGAGGTPLDVTLKKAGHRPVLVATPGELDQALRTGGYDVVLADISDASLVQRALPEGSRLPALLPVMDGRTREELAAAKKTYPGVIRSTAKQQWVLDPIDEAMAFRAKNRANSAK